MLVIVTAAVLVAVNFVTIKDFFVGMGYMPTRGMTEIRESLQLTGRGEFLFKASRPELDERGDFNRNCRDEDTETAILGCYRDEKIFIYNIVDDELAGIRELTTAHELLHAVYARMSESEQAKWGELLATVYEQNKDILEEEIEAYDEGERAEELYVRAGTEVRDLPEALEEHYGEIFRNQDRVVGYYESYIAAFLEIDAAIDELDTEMKAALAQINTRTAEYERRTAQLAADIVSFNACAEVAGCFKADGEFWERRGRLVTEREALTEMYSELNEMIDEYNEMVGEYNANVIHGQMLNDLINSAVEPEEIE